MKVIMQSSSLSCEAKITMNGSLPGCQAQPSEGGVCQSRDLQSVQVNSDVKYSMFKAQTGIRSPPP